MTKTTTHPLSLLALYLLFSSSLFHSTLAKPATYNVVAFGAKPDGTTDSTNALVSAWKKACGSAKPASILVPRGKFLVGRAVTFSGKCGNKAISITIRGTLVAPSEYNFIGNSLHWFMFDRVSGVSIHGGVLDARGTSLWHCKNSPTNLHCPSGAATLGFINSDNILITGLTSLHSQMFHVTINGCHNVKLHGLKAIAARNSPNTDGIHVQFSNGVTIIKPSIHTGDDCISIGPGTRNLWIEDATCGPGHGISIGSLGWDMNEPGVKNVTVRKTTFIKTQNGFRIKSWGRPSRGFVKDVHFEGATMIDVQNPILIDQSYCPHNICPSHASGVKISDVSYRGIHGTSATSVAVNFDCSSKEPCERITLEDVKLSYKNKASQALCNHADGTALGIVQPHSCL